LFGQGIDFVWPFDFTWLFFKQGIDLMKISGFPDLVRGLCASPLRQPLRITAATAQVPVRYFIHRR
jgi:hypothetical protein